jgi:hypothetical protein
MDILKLALTLDTFQPPKKVQRLLSVYDQIQAPSTLQDPLSQGHETNDRIREALELIDEKFMQRTTEQVHLCRLIQASAANYTYGSAMRLHAKDIEEYNRFGKVTKGVLISAPRRFGKTQVFSMCGAALFHECPGIEITCIANSPNAAHMIIQKIRYILVLVFGVSKFLVDNKQHLVWKVSESDVRQLHAFSGKIGDG